MTTSHVLRAATGKPWLRRLFWTTAGVLALWALAWLLVPPLLKSQLVKLASAQIGRTLSVGEIDFKPWSLELTLRDLAIAGRDGVGVQLAVKRVYVNAELESLVRLAPVVNTLMVDGLQVHLRRLAGGGYDIDDILARLAAAPPGDNGKPLRFALFNLSLRDGSVDFDDQPANRRHELRALTLTLPFLSNLPAQRMITVKPQLAFTLNGSHFDSSAASTPFAQTHKTDARLRIAAMDLAPYLPYIPSSVPVRLKRAVLDADLQLKFAQEASAQVLLTGELKLSGVALSDAAGGDLLAFDGLKLVLDEARPLEQQIRIASVEMQAPRLYARRDAAGQLNLLLAGNAAAAPAAGPATAPAAPASATASATATAPSGAAASASAAASPGAVVTAAASAGAPAGGWQVAITKVALRDGALAWSDASVAPAADAHITELALDLRDVVWPMASALAFNGSMVIGAPGEANNVPGGVAKLVLEGTATDREVHAKLALTNASLGLAAPYLRQFLVPDLSGQLQAELSLDWKPTELQLAVASLTLDRLALVSPGAARRADLATLRKLAVGDARLDLARRSLTVGKIELTQPEATISRAADKSWMFAQWLRPQPVAATASADPPAAPWQGKVDEVLLRAGALRFDDAAAPVPVAFDVSALNLELKGLQFDGKKPVAAHLSARLAARNAEAGTLDYRGTIQPVPLLAKGSVRAEQLPLHVFEPYFGSSLNIEVARADAGFKGDVEYADNARGPSARLRGDIVLEDFRANTIAARGGEAQLAQELLNWKALGLRGVDLALAPGQPLRVAVRETTLSDFFARVIVHENGRINLQDIVRSDTPAQPLDGAAGAPASATSQPAAVAAAPAAPAPAPSAVPAPDPLAPVIQIGPVSLVQGKVFFSDRFVKPNYSANLSELTGKLSAFSSHPVAGEAGMADLELRGRAEGTASLEILGKLNPLVRPLALDIKGKVRDLELPPLSPYAVKYAGHGIERGKLSVDVAYLIKPDGQLSASNQIILNQLAFGDKVEGAPNSLPVRLAVALLADRNGIIDINLPISGSLNDPQFRLGPIIFKVIVNLIGKALTAPFSLLASAFGGGGDELSQVAFASGSALLPAQALPGLDKVAKALTDRPMLRLTVIGTADLERERGAYQHRRLQELLQAEKRRASVRAGAVAPTRPVAGTPGAATAAATASSAPTAPARVALPLPAAAVAAVPAPGAAPLDPAEATELLRQVYLRSEIVKPRDLAGKAKVLEPAEMEALLLANIPVDADAMRELALQRGVAVKDYLISRQLPAERLFLGAAKTTEPDPKWSPRAELTLSNN